MLCGDGRSALGARGGVGLGQQRREALLAGEELPEGVAQVGIEGVRRIDAIFDAHRALADLAPAQRKLRRDAEVRPVVDTFFTWVAEQKAKLEGRGLVATALGYCLRHEAALRRFLDDGRLRMDNNSAERALRPIAVGRKAWMFYGSDDHASAAGNILSLVASCTGPPERAAVQRLQPIVEVAPPIAQDPELVEAAPLTPSQAPRAAPRSPRSPAFAPRPRRRVAR